MKVIIHPSRLKGTIAAPASKSSMQRACAAALLHRGVTLIRKPGESNDDRAALGIIRALGAEITETDDGWQVRGGEIRPVTGKLDCGESGLGIRMFTPLAALSDQRLTITGSGSLAGRPMHFFGEVLPRLGVAVSSNEGKLPLVVRGPLQPADIEVDGSMSSQFLTGLLLAYAAAGARNVSIKVSKLASRPYIDLTLSVMRDFGLKTPENRAYREFYFDDAAPPLQNTMIDYTVERDWSGGAFLLVAGAIAGPVTITGLDLTSAQADKAILEVLMTANAGVAVEAKGIKIRPAEMNAFHFDATDCPDLFPPLVALAAFCKGNSTISGLNRLLYKESNRAQTLQEEFGKMGIVIRLQDDIMIIEGGMGVKGSEIYSHHDHRIAMAASVAALGAAGETVIHEAGAVRKSYPGFFNDLKSLGADVSLPDQQFNL